MTDIPELLRLTKSERNPGTFGKTDIAHHVVGPCRATRQDFSWVFWLVFALWIIMVMQLAFTMRILDELVQLKQAVGG